VLIDAQVEDVAKVGGQRVAAMVKAFREQKLIVVPGGGGRYGHLEVPPDLAEVQQPEAQRTLMEFE